jgi:UDP-N-acetylglucosamine--N-acetylmuramyl-(pentapeptide) pyrophosphoryl-undecaprenol N-acetylglucosamine transferase
MISMSDKNPFRVIVSAGGTGGDLFPAVAVVEQLARLTAVEAVFVGNPNRIEATVVPSLGYQFVPLSVTGYKGLTSLDTYKLPFRILDSTSTCKKLIRSFKPHVALCAGTYISYPLSLSAKAMDIPLAMIESNAIPGKANKKIAKHAKCIIAAFEECKKHLPVSSQQYVHVVGNPIRSMMNELPKQQSARLALGLKPDLPTLFVLGGSLGARSFNQTIEQSLEHIAELPIQILWQTGKSYTAPKELPMNVRSMQFVEDMATAYSSADLLLTRAGGGTVAELGVVGKPAVFIPYPHAANNEQEHNARVFEKAGSALMIRDSELHSRFKSDVLPLLMDTQRLTSMSTIMKTFGKPNAAIDSAKLVYGM